jgi:hypothetical protein
MVLRREYKGGIGRVYVDENDREYPSVTTVLQTLSKGPWLERWQDTMRVNHFTETFDKHIESLDGDTRNKVNKEKVHRIFKSALAAPNNYRDMKGAQGDFYHKMLESYLKDDKGEHPVEWYLAQDERAEKVLNNFKKWVWKTQLKPIKVEHYLHSTKYGFAGTVDLVGTQTTKDGDKELVLVDFKTGSVQKDQLLQLAAYAKAYEERFFLRPKRAFFLKVDVDAGSVGEQLRVENGTLEQLFELYMCSFRLWCWRNDVKFQVLDE